LVFREDIPHHAAALFFWAVKSERWEGLAREVLALGARSEVAPKVRKCAEQYLPDADPDGYLHVAAVLAVVDDAEILRLVAETALASSDPEVRENGSYILEHYRECLARL
jgi:hypothetical protein